MLSNMKCVFLYFCVAALLSKAVCKIDFSDSYEAGMNKVIDECQADPATHASEEWIETEDLETADKEGAHILCRLTKIGSLNENGDVDKKAMENDLKKGIKDPKVIEEIMEKCGTRPPDLTAIESAVSNFKCVLSTFKSLTENE